MVAIEAVQVLMKDVSLFFWLVVQKICSSIIVHIGIILPTP